MSAEQPGLAKAPRPAAEARREGWQGEGFGVVLRGAAPVIGIGGADRAAVEPTLLLLDDGVGGPPVGGTRVRTLRDRAGRTAMTIDDHGPRGLRISAADFGAHQISADGRIVRSCVPDAGDWRWQRLLVGQVLPLVAALRGLEVLHASAVARDGLAFALTGAAGAGKSTLAAHLALRGNSLLAEDVLAVSVAADGTPRAHRGSTALALRPDEAALAAELVRSTGATPLGSGDKELLALPPGEASLPLAAVYRLERCGRRGDALAAPRDASLADLLQASFVRYVTTPARLAAQLETLAAIAQHCPLVSVNVEAGGPPAALAAELEAHMDGVGTARRP